MFGLNHNLIFYLKLSQIIDLKSSQKSYPKLGQILYLTLGKILYLNLGPAVYLKANQMVSLVSGSGWPIALQAAAWLVMTLARGLLAHGLADGMKKPRR